MKEDRIQKTESRKDKKPLVVFIAGPTASGKSELAIELAQRINAEIISADSMQVYRGLDILSAKPSPELRQRVRHHLIDIVDPTAEYSAALFREQALKLIRQVHTAGKIPLVVGGTGLYLQALTRGIFDDKGKDESLRAALVRKAELKGPACLHEELKRIDPEAAAKIHPHNIRRIIRALEAYETNKIPFSQLGKTIEPLTKEYRVILFAIKRNRDELYQRINERVDAMFKRGVVDEVQRLRAKELGPTARQALGIKQISCYVEGKCTRDEAIDSLKRDTRRYAKRQLTWFRHDKDIVWIHVKDTDSIQDVCLKISSLLPAQ